LEDKSVGIILGGVLVGAMFAGAAVSFFQAGATSHFQWYIQYYNSLGLGCLGTAIIVLIIAGWAVIKTELGADPRTKGWQHPPNYYYAPQRAQRALYLNEYTVVCPDCGFNVRLDVTPIRPDNSVVCPKCFKSISL
jgi:hypothetical protein